MISNRLDRLRQGLVEKEIDAILISRPENRYYLSGFDGSAGFLLIAEQDEIIAVDSRFTEQARIQAAGFDAFQINGEVENWLPRLFGELSLKRLGFEADHISFALYSLMSGVLASSKIQLRLVPVEGLVESMRTIKEPEEIELITRAVAISDAAMNCGIDIVRAGMTELDLAWQVEKFLHEKGSLSIPFDFVVAAGPNTAMPHAKPSERKIQYGEPILIDIGAKVEGYGSDISRTICLGEPDDTFKKVYDIVLRAQKTAIDGIVEAMSGTAADRLARGVIKQAGYGEQFSHSLGHGLGLSTHEKPYIRHNSKDNLINNMVFTIEPGIYIPGWGGVRIEDTVVLENGKIKVLSQVKK